MDIFETLLMNHLRQSKKWFENKQPLQIFWKPDLVDWIQEEQASLSLKQQRVPLKLKQE